MLFSSGTFWVFFVLVGVLIELNSRLFKSVKFQNFTLLIASYFFYGYWDWRFLGLIALVTLQTFIFGKLIGKKNRFRRLYLCASVSVNVLILGFFKYFNFFASEFYSVFGFGNSYVLQNIVLPVGISFYIFQSLTYVIDIYFEKLELEESLINYSAYIAFFPQLVAGPIERAKSLLPQFRSIKSIRVENLYTGIKICIVGLFLKIFIADNLADSVDFIFTDYQNLNGGTLALGAVYFTIQIYGDFCGYSLIAIGAAKIIGFDLMKNFQTPYFSTSIQEFWRNWHISLSTFFRDYVYIPLGGNRLTNILTSRNILLTFLLSGLWHGANWTFIIWGLMHGFLLVFQREAAVNVQKYIGWFLTMSTVVVLWVLFRSESINDFTQYILRIFSNLSLPEKGRSDIIFLLYYILIDIVLFKYKEEGTVWFNSQVREGIVLSVMLLLVVGTIHNINPNFIYFKF